MTSKNDDPLVECLSLLLASLDAVKDDLIFDHVQMAQRRLTSIIEGTKHMLAARLKELKQNQEMNQTVDRWMNHE